MIPGLDPDVARGIALIHRLLVLEVARMREAGVPVGEDDYRGLYVSDAEADRLVAALPGPLADSPTHSAYRREVGELHASACGPLARLCALGGLDAFDLGVLLLALAAEADLGTERLIGYVQDDVTKKRPRVELALRALTPAAEFHARREHFAPGAPLRRLHLVSLLDEAGNPQTPLLARAIALDPRVAGYLLGERALDEALHPFVVQPGEMLAALEPETAERVAALAALPAATLAPPVVALSGPDPAARETAAAMLATASNLGLVRVDFASAVADLGFDEAAVRSLREGAFSEAAVVIDGVDTLSQSDGERLRNTLTRAPLAPLVLLGSRVPFNWPGVRIELPGLDFEAQQASWNSLLAGEDVAEADVAALAGKFRLTAHAIAAAVEGARGHARWRDPAAPRISLEDLQAAARTQSTPILSDLARKIVPHYAWDDIILPADAREQLREMCGFVEHRHTVYDLWGMGRKLAMGKGILALFAGSSGTGKTMSADVIAGTLGLDLYKIDLSGIVSKYIGETEKNLATIFAEAETANAILFFDEADALFGKRSEVKDAHDRYANIETAYLLQKMEEYSGMVILATNLKSNLDEAFLRRLHFVVDFPMPEEEDRLRIWRATVPASLPVSPDVDFGFLARQFKIAGGNIRNIVLAAAFMGAGEGGEVHMGHFIRGVRREYQKLGRMVTDAEFGSYVGFLRPT
ncbi:MAG: ATP-binding protein [Thermoflexaceae bacterium]|nr:ATP-binding protein [Thermoflexaceae bacterium]